MQPHRITAALLAASLSVPAVAAPISIVADAGNVSSVTAGSPEATAGFVVGEAVQLTFTFDDTTPDGLVAIGTAIYADPTATVTLTGQTSGASVDYADGLRIAVLSDASIEFSSISNPANAVDTRVIANDIDYITNAGPFFTDVDDLSQVFADLLANPFPSPEGFTSSTSYWNGSAAVQGMGLTPPPGPSVFALATPSLAADFNGDGTVDLLDFDILAQNFGTVGGATNATGDANGDGTVDLLDFDALAQEFGSSSLATIPGVPEPASAALLGLGGMVAARRRR